MHQQLEDYRSEFLALKDTARSLVSDVDQRTLRRAPRPDAWSIAQLFDHMNTAGWLLLTPLEDAIQAGVSDGPYGDPPFEYGFISRWFVRTMKPSSKWTFTAPSVFEPEQADTLYPDEVVAEFLGLQDEFAGCVADANGLDLRRIRVSSPAVPLLRISLGAWFEATIAHEQRHLAQAERVLHQLEEG